MEQFTRVVNKDDEAGDQLSDVGCHQARTRRQPSALAIWGMVSVETAAPHSGLDPDIDKITHLLAENPNRVDLLIRRGQLYRSNGELIESLNDLDIAGQLDRDNPEIVFQRSLTLSALGRDNEAEAGLDRFLEAASGREQALALAERGHVRARTGRPELAIADFTSAVSTQPTVSLYLVRGQLQESLGKLDEAAWGYREGLSRFDGATILKRALIRVAMARERFSEALTLIDEELARTSVKTTWYLHRAEVLAAMGQAEATRALGKRPTAIHRFSLAKVYIAMGRLEEASLELSLVVQRGPGFLDARELLRTLEGE